MSTFPLDADNCMTQEESDQRFLEGFNYHHKYPYLYDTIVEYNWYDFIAYTLSHPRVNIKKMKNISFKIGHEQFNKSTHVWYDENVYYVIFDLETKRKFSKLLNY